MADGSGPLDRRRFLSLCTGGLTGIWLAGSGFVAMPRRMVLKHVGHRGSRPG